MIYVLGGANMDIYGIPRDVLNQKDSNIGTVKKIHGGVARNIVESLARLSVPTCFMSVFGNDTFGNELIARLKELNVDYHHSLIIDNEPTSTYLAVMDETNDMNVAICDNRIMKYLTKDKLQAFVSEIKDEDLLVMDTNLAEDIIAYVMDNTKAKIFIDPLSIAKSQKIQNHMNRIFAFKPNVYEASSLVGLEVNSEEDLKKIGQALLEKGVEHIFISLGSKGMFYLDKDGSYIISTTPCEMVNASGAGDACMAGIIYGYATNKPLKEIVELAMSNAVLAIRSEDTVNQKLNLDVLMNQKTKMDFRWRKI